MCRDFKQEGTEGHRDEGTKDVGKEGALGEVDLRSDRYAEIS